MKTVRALVLTGYGLNCDYETDFSLTVAGAQSSRIHINDLIQRPPKAVEHTLGHYHILVFGGGFSWGDDHGAGVLMAAKIRHHLGEEISRFISEGKLILGICNGFQAIVNLGLLPALYQRYGERQAALTYNDCGNFIDTWVYLKVNKSSPCVFTRGLTALELPVRHGEGKFYAAPAQLQAIVEANQVALTYTDAAGNPAQGSWPSNPNGSLGDVAGICDPTGRIFGLMPHPEAYNHFTNHPNWTEKKLILQRQGKKPQEHGAGIRIFENAVRYVEETLL